MYRMYSRLLKVLFYTHSICLCLQYICCMMAKTSESAKFLCTKMLNKITNIQGWEFAHRFSQRIARFCKKWANEQFAQKNEPFAHLLIFGERTEQFPHIAHQKWGNEQIAHLYTKKKPILNMSDHEGFAHIAHFWWATWAIRSHRSPTIREWENR